jgi:VIT1/CCC1 family predicted Fe2+/Mn2+ transporter
VKVSEIPRNTSKSDISLERFLISLLSTITLSDKGVIMFLSFATFGAMPLLGYVIIPILFPDLGPEILFKAACIVTGLVLFFLGSVKSKFA